MVCIDVLVHVLLNHSSVLVFGSLHGKIVTFLRACGGVFEYELGDCGRKAAWGNVAVDGDGGAAKIEDDLYGSVDVVCVGPNDAEVVNMGKQSGASNGIVTTRGWACGIGSAASRSQGVITPPVADCSDISPAIMEHLSEGGDVVRRGIDVAKDQLGVGRVQCELSECRLEECVSASCSQLAPVSVSPAVDADQVNWLGPESAQGDIDATAFGCFAEGIRSDNNGPCGSGAAHQGCNSRCRF